jgi:PAS domain S-box-containing protein
MDVHRLKENLIHPEDFSLVLNAIFNESKDGIFITDGTGTVVMLNRASEEMLGLDAGQVIGMNVGDIVEQGYYDRSVALLAIEKQHTVSIIQNTFTNKKILTTGIPIFRNNEIQYIFVNDRDVTTLSSYISLLEEDGFRGQDLHLQFSQQELIVSSIGDVIINGPTMQGVLRKIEKAAATDCPVLLTGETGVGKSLFAKLAHDLSPRKNSSFMDVNCAAINENLYDSELFGYERGAFTGAHIAGKAGLIEASSGGSLFLDEINIIPLYLQAKLLKFLDNSAIRRVGGTRQVPVDTRIIVAASDDLEQMITRGEFRKDLYYRLNVVPVHIPPLRERQEEVEFLIDYFVYYYANKYGIHKKLSPEAKYILTEYDYPGNVRELENIMRQLLVLSEREVLTRADIPGHILRKTHSSGDLQYEPDSRLETNQYRKMVSRYETDYIRQVVARYGSQRKAAKFLGISQSTLSRKLSRRPRPYLIHK